MREMGAGSNVMTSSPSEGASCTSSAPRDMAMASSGKRAGASGDCANRWRIDWKAREAADGVLGDVELKRGDAAAVSADEGALATQPVHLGFHHLAPWCSRQCVPLPLLSRLGRWGRR